MITLPCIARLTRAACVIRAARNIALGRAHPRTPKHGPCLLALFLACLPLKTWAQIDLTPDTHLKRPAHYDRDRFLPGGHEGERNLCCQVMEIDRERVIVLPVSGPDKPWWGDEVLKAIKQQRADAEGCPTA